MSGYCHKTEALIKESMNMETLHMGVSLSLLRGVHSYISYIHVGCQIQLKHNGENAQRPEKEE